MNNRPSPTLRTMVAFGFSMTFAAWLAACSTSKPVGKVSAASPETRSASNSEVQMNKVPEVGSAIRVGGDMTAKVTGKDGAYRSGPCSIDTPLPAGYPLPTPPQAIEIKSYPSVRLAEVDGSGSPDRGMNATFWPLFNHIKKHDIAMTSPVEMYYEGMDDAGSKPESWSMAFLYRTPELNDTGTEGNVKVRDAEPVVVVAVGLKGDYSMELVEKGQKQLTEWLAANPQWRKVGDWRSLYYNGPSLMFWNKWAEVQVPVKLIGGK